jgi:hypothetical protein
MLIEPGDPDDARRGLSIRYGFGRPQLRLPDEHTILGGPADRYIVWAQYEYVVDGVAYQSDRISYALDFFSRNEEAQAKLLPYPPGAGIWVFHDPHDPGTAVLERTIAGFGPMLKSLVAVSIGLVVGGFCVIAMFLELLALVFRH